MKNLSVISAFASGLGIGVALIGFAACNKGGGGASGSGVVAVVNGTPITEKEFLRYMMLKPSVSVQSNKGPVEARVAQPIGFQALNDLMKQKLVVQMAKKEDAFPTEQAIADEIKFRLDGDPNFIKNLNAQGLDMDMIKQAITVELCQDNLVGKGITVSDADIDQYKKQHPEQFMQPASTDIEWILVRTPEAKKQVDAQLANGAKFGVVAQQFSEAPGAKEAMGVFPKRLDREIPKEILAEVKNIPPLKMTGWIDGAGNSGSAKFYVARRTPAKPIEITPHVKELVRRQIKQQRGANAREIGKQILAEQKSSSVQINLEGLQPTWDAYMKQLTQASAIPSLTKPATAGTTATTTGGATAPAATMGK